MGGNQFDEDEVPKEDPTYQKSETAGELQTQLLLAAANDDKLALQRYWLKEIDMNISDWDQRTALHVAASEGNYTTCKFLLEVCKVNPSPQDRWLQTPLTEALRFGFPNIVALIKKVISQYPERVIEVPEVEKEEVEEELERIMEGEVFEVSHVRDNSSILDDEEILLAGTPRTRAAAATNDNSLHRMAGMFAPSDTLLTNNLQPRDLRSRRNSISQQLNPLELQQALLVRNSRSPGASPSRSPVAPRSPPVERSLSGRQSPPPLVVNIECPSD